MNFSFMTASGIIFSRGAHKNIGEYIKGMGTRALILCGNSLKGKKLDAITVSLCENGVESFCHFIPSHEPDTNTVDDAVKAFNLNACDMIISIGGGSVIDAGKAASGIVTNGGFLQDYLEGVGIGKKIVNDPVTFVALPTTHGTGAEVTKNAVISSSTELYKKSIRDDRLLPKKVIIDAELMTSLPKKQTAHCSMDALTQLIEAYTSAKASPITDALCISGIKMVADSIYEAYDNGDDVDAREKMAYASLMSGICLANAGLGAVHGVAPALGISCNISHGESCAVMLDHVMRYNLDYVTKKYADIGRILNKCDIADDNQAALSAIEYVSKLKAHMQIPSDLKYLGLTAEDLPTVVKRCSSNSMNANPVKLSTEDVTALLENLI